MRYLFGKSLQDWAIRPPSDTPLMESSDGSDVSSVVLAAPFTAALVSLTEGGPEETDFEDTNGNPITVVQTDGDGYVSPFYGPEDVSILWFSFNAGDTWFQVVSTDVLAAAASYVPPLVVIGVSETEPPPGTPVGTLVFREVF